MSDSADQIDRSTPLGFFNYAESYWRAAQALDKAKLATTHSHAPIRFLYYHAIELYLKAFLRLHGVTATALRSKTYGHKTASLSQRARNSGCR